MNVFVSSSTNGRAGVFRASVSESLADSRIFLFNQPIPTDSALFGSALIPAINSFHSKPLFPQSTPAKVGSQPRESAAGLFELPGTSVFRLRTPSRTFSARVRAESARQRGPLVASLNRFVLCGISADSASEPSNLWLASLQTQIANPARNGATAQTSIPARTASTTRIVPFAEFLRSSVFRAGVRGGDKEEGLRPSSEWTSVPRGRSSRNRTDRRENRREHNLRQE